MHMYPACGITGPPTCSDTVQRLCVRRSTPVSASTIVASHPATASPGSSRASSCQCPAPARMRFSATCAVAKEGSITDLGAWKDHWPLPTRQHAACEARH